MIWFREWLFYIFTEKLHWAEVASSSSRYSGEQERQDLYSHRLYIVMVLKPGFLEIWILGTHCRLPKSENVG